MLPEVRMARVLGAISLHRGGRLSCVEAGELLGFSERHFRRLRDTFEVRGKANVAFIILMVLVTVAVIDFISSRLRLAFVGERSSAQ